MSCRHCHHCGALLRPREAMCADCYAELSARQDKLDEERMEAGTAGEEGVEP